MPDVHIGFTGTRDAMPQVRRPDGDDPAMNASEDGLEPLGEAPDLGAPHYPMSAEVTFHRARCTKCGDIETDYGDFSAYSDPGGAINAVLAAADWFGRSAPTGELIDFGGGRMGQRYQLVELLCPDCQRCEVCGTAKAYPINDHLVCEDHEDHEFEAAP
ncbi:hypothetical protein PBI_DLANE_64 [Mycobacterium phage DLane]|uniref:Uncharacterized protein n=2 Tax=Cheoctovirus TaxID=1623281 RepID=A0A3G3LZY8_9CAUD|nr:hypothetical protein FGG21_gp064 [Mycobacterium phage DLane]YP_009957056.1 hypothetical protein I5H37_gp067 [Mycobacterium phage Filuzino]AEK08608.1 hypothetical protein PBI_DLANE_64 [Mycobacterium phage DLane]AYQ99413.1 hypothetical protein PBI_FILUZINO_67 [Mycobacterium phage Filuzino]